MKDKLGGNIVTEFAELRPKKCSYLTDDNDENKKQKAHKVELEKRNIVQKQFNLKIK